MSGDMNMVRGLQAAIRVFSGFSILAAFSLTGSLPAMAIGALGPDNDCKDPEIQSTEMALFEPDKYAWKLFEAVNHPANVWEQCPDTKKKLGAEGPVVWETWRNPRRGAQRTVFRLKGAYPGPWRNSSPNKEELDRMAGVFAGPLVKLERDVHTLRNVPNNPNRKRAANSQFGSRIIGAEEVRINRDTYLHIRDNELYNRDTLVKLAALGEPASLDLPIGTKEVKARWTEITEEDKPRYHWTVFKDKEGVEHLWGLTGLHITTKDLPNWFWTTFEHVDIAPEFVNQSRDAYACPDQPIGCDASPAELKGTKWENYRLRGTQTNFVDPRGRTVTLANSQIEDGIETRSSCMTCHSEAALEQKGRQIALSDAFTGKPKENKVGDIMQLDFMFIFKNASSPSDKS